MSVSWLLVVHVKLQNVEDWSHGTGKDESDSGRREERVRRVRELQNLRRPSLNQTFILSSNRQLFALRYQDIRSYSRQVTHYGRYSIPNCQLHCCRQCYQLGRT